MKVWISIIAFLLAMTATAEGISYNINLNDEGAQLTFQIDVHQHGRVVFRSPLKGIKAIYEGTLTTLPLIESASMESLTKALNELGIATYLLTQVPSANILLPGTAALFIGDHASLVDYAGNHYLLPESFKQLGDRVKIRTFGSGYGADRDTLIHEVSAQEVGAAISPGPAHRLVTSGRISFIETFPENRKWKPKLYQIPETAFFTLYGMSTYGPQVHWTDDGKSIGGTYYYATTSLPAPGEKDSPFFLESMMKENSGLTLTGWTVESKTIGRAEKSRTKILLGSIRAPEPGEPRMYAAGERKTGPCNMDLSFEGTNVVPLFPPVDPKD